MIIFVNVSSIQIHLTKLQTKQTKRYRLQVLTILTGRYLEESIYTIKLIGEESILWKMLKSMMTSKLTKEMSKLTKT